MTSMPLPSLSAMSLRDNQSPQLIRSVIACMVLAGLAMLGRLVSRRIKKLSLLTSDYLAIVGLIGAWAVSAAGIAAATFGLGKHIQVVPLENLEPLFKNLFVAEICYTVTLPVIKISILFFYREIFLGKKFNVLTYTLGAIVLAWFLAILVAELVSCRPLKGNWIPKLDPPAKCINKRAEFIGNSVPNILTDVAILCLPIGKVWRLQTSRTSKVAIGGLFLCGGVVVIVSIVRFIYILGKETQDITWDRYGVAIWSAVEVNIAVVSACLPTMRPVARKLIPGGLVSWKLSRTEKKRSSSTEASSPTPKTGKFDPIEHIENSQQPPQPPLKVPLPARVATNQRAQTTDSFNSDLELGQVVDQTDDHTLLRPLPRHMKA